MERIISSKGICKALYYTQSDFLDQPDIPYPSDLIMSKIFPFYRIPGTEEEASTYILLSFRNYRPIRGNHFKSGQINIFTITHKSLVITDYGFLRFDYLTSEIDKLMNDQRGVGIGKLEFHGMDEVHINEDYLGNVISYRPVDWG